MILYLLIVQWLIALALCERFRGNSKVQYNDGIPTHSTAERPRPEDDTDPDPDMCVDPGLMNYVICDRSLEKELPADKEEVLQTTGQFLRMNYTSRFDLGVCQCCNINISGKSDLRICNRKTEPTNINWPLIGMVGRSIIKEARCSHLNNVKGSFTWTSTLQIWTLYVLGAGSPLLKDETLQCSTLVHKSPLTNSSTPTTPSPGLSTGSPNSSLQAGVLAGLKSQYIGVVAG